MTNAYESLSRRRKSFSHRGSVFFEADPDDDFEWLTVVYESPRRLVLVLQLMEGNRAHLFVRSNRARDRGKILVRMEDLYLVDNGTLLTEAVDATIDLVSLANSPKDVSSQATESIWKGLLLRVAPDAH